MWGENKNMQILRVFITILVISIFTYSCSRKTVPPGPTHKASMPAAKDSAASEKKKIVMAPKPPTPKSIVVNDRAAKKTVDGRLYYDLDGKRYWKNYKDGKYYLYNKSMHDNPEFRPAKN